MDSTKQTEDKPKSREGDSRNGWSKIRSDKPNAKTKSGLALLDPGLSADRGELLVLGDNSNVDFLPSSSLYKIQTAAKMTRATQTISIFLLVSSVCSESELVLCR
jgi:hypothetical protein